VLGWGLAERKTVLQRWQINFESWMLIITLQYFKFLNISSYCTIFYFVSKTVEANFYSYAIYFKEYVSPVENLSRKFRKIFMNTKMNNNRVCIPESGQILSFYNLTIHIHGAFCQKSARIFF
jgi:hypothetical protein